MGSKILVLNLTRMGDLIQTTPLIKGLREKEPDCHITLLSNVKFAGILGMVDGIDEVLIFDVRQFGSAGGEETDALAVYKYLDTLTRDLNSRRFDMVINLSHSKLTAVMAMLTGAPDTRGFVASPEGDRLVGDPWLVYFTSFLMFRRYNRFNLVDMYMRGAGVEPGDSRRLGLIVSDKALSKARQRMEELGVKPDEIIIGIQAGASRADRRWNPKSFAAVADHLSTTRGARIALFGAASEKTLGDEVEAAMTEPAINLIGVTDLEELAGWVKLSNLLVTNDTGTMHIAAAVGTPIVGLFFVHAKCDETGPYTEGSIILEADIACAPCSHSTVCDHYSCLRYVTPEDVIAACESALDGDMAPLEKPGLFGKTKVYRSAFGEDGGVEFEPPLKPELTAHEFFARLYRPLFIEALARWDDPQGMELADEVIHNAIDKMSFSFSLPPGHDIETWTGRALEGGSRLAGLAAESAALAEEIEKGGGRIDIKNTGERLASVDVDISVLSGVYEMTAPLVNVYRRRQENFQGADPAGLARQVAKAAEWLKQSTGIYIHAVKTARGALLTKETLKNTAISSGEIRK